MTKYTTPDINLLWQSEPRKKMPTAEYNRRVANMQQILESYGIQGNVQYMTCSPVVTNYHFTPAKGVRMADVRAISEDIACALATDDRIIIEQVPYEHELNIAVPNVERHTVRIGSLIFGDEFPTCGCVIPWLLGTDADRLLPVVRDLTDMEHVLIAGCPGTGKSMLLQSLVLSVAYTCEPDFCKLVLIDTKGDTFEQCDKMPHLAVPVAKTETDGALALKSVVREVDNRLAQKSTDWPLMVVIIDEVYDMLAMSCNDISHIAHYGARVGVHLVMATWYADGTPSAVCLRAHVPTRMVFRTYTRMDSIQSLRTRGAENLQDYGDMLISDKKYRQTRVHTALIAADDIKRVMNFMCLSEADARLYELAKSYVLGDKRPSLSYLQRGLHIGYNKASELMERMEAEGLVTTPDEKGKRRLIPQES